MLLFCSIYIVLLTTSVRIIYRYGYIVVGSDESSIDYVCIIHQTFQLASCPYFFIAFAIVPNFESAFTPTSVPMRYIYI
jgi:hypothetical protein